MSLKLFFFHLWCSFGPLEVGYRATKVFVSGSMEYFGGQDMYWVLFNLGRANQWFQYNTLKVFLGFFVMWIVFCRRPGHLFRKFVHLSASKYVLTKVLHLYVLNIESVKSEKHKSVLRT